MTLINPLANHLVIFAKEPRLGRVKTRLAADIGPLAALAFYRKTLFSVTRRLGGDSRWTTWLAVTPDRAVFEDASWPPTHGRITLITQGRGDLGRRMAGVADSLAPGPAIIIGGDVPDIQPHHIAAAFRALGHHDAVFGPAEDGGYWLVGMKRRPAFTDFFKGVRFSSQHALADTIANLAPGQRHALLETLADIDDGEAFRRWKKG